MKKTIWPEISPYSQKTPMVKFKFASVIWVESNRGFNNDYAAFGHSDVQEHHLF